MGANAPYLYTYVLNLAKNINKIKVYVKIALHYCNTVFFIFAPSLPYLVQIYPCKCLICPFRHKTPQNYPQAQKIPPKEKFFSLAGTIMSLVIQNCIHCYSFVSLHNLTDTFQRQCILLAFSISYFILGLLYITISSSSPWP